MSRSRSSATSWARRTRRRSRAAGSSRRAPSMASGSRSAASSPGTSQPGPASPRRIAAMTSSSDAWARLPRAGPSEGPRRTSRTDSQPGSMMKAAEERPASSTRRRGRARWPRIVKRASASGSPARAASSSARSSSRRATSRPSGPSAGASRAAARAASRAAASPCCPAAITPHHRAQGSPSSARSRATTAAAGWSSASRVAARPVAARGESPMAEEADEQRHLAPAALGAPRGGGSCGGDEGVGHGIERSGGGRGAGPRAAAMLAA